MFGRKAARIRALERELVEAWDDVAHFRGLAEMWRGTAEAMRPCRFETRQFDGWGSVAFCLTHLCVHDSNSSAPTTPCLVCHEPFEVCDDCAPRPEGEC